MLVFKRLLTAIVLFVVLFGLLSIGGLVIGGAALGAKAGAGVSQGESAKQDFQSGYEAGHQAGYEFGKRYGPMIFLGAFAISAVASLALSFTGIFPWCCASTAPPEYPVIR